MQRRTTRVVSGVSVVLGVVVGSLMPGGMAGATSASGAIGPNQTFFGVVNGDQASATVKVACPEAVQPHQMGHPASGQSIGVKIAPTSKTTGGFTGPRGQTIVARFASSTPTSSAAATTVTFSHYGSEPLPTTLLLPCLGTGTLVFSPRPNSATARSETLSVSYVTPCPGICADSRR